MSRPGRAFYSSPEWATTECVATSGRVPGQLGLLRKTDVERVTDNGVVTVGPGARQKWLVAVDGRDGELAFSTRQLAIDFARAYAKLRSASTMQVFNAKGALEDEEKVDLSLRQSVKA